MVEFDIIINLQLFAEEKTEPATQKKRSDARQKGQVAKSRELITAMLLLVTFMTLRIFAASSIGNLMDVIQMFLTFPENIDSAVSTESLINVYIKCLWIFTKIMAPLLIISAVVAIALNYLQVGFLFTLKPLAPKFDKLNPIQGFKNIFSKKAFVEFLKSIFKIAVIGYLIYSYLKTNFEVIPELLALDMLETAVFIGNTMINTGIRVAAVLIVMSVFDYAFQFWEHEKSLKMTKQ